MAKKKSAPPAGSALSPLTESQRQFLSELCNKHYNGLFKYACTLTSAQDAEELMQELFLLAARRIDKLMESPKPDGWLAKSLVFLAKNWRARQNIRQKHEAGPIENDTQIPASEETGNVDVELSLQKTLTPQDYDLYRMVYYEGYTMKEAAARLGATPAATWKRMERLRKRLRNHFDEM